jgi:hypothetical protein
MLISRVESLIVDAQNDLNVYRETTEDGTRRPGYSERTSVSGEAQPCCAPIGEDTAKPCCDVESATLSGEMQIEGSQANEIDQFSTADLNEYAGKLNQFPPPIPAIDGFSLGSFKIFAVKP